MILCAPPPLVAPTEALSPAGEAAGFRLPPGFEAQLVAAEPDISKPMNLAWDDRGRLWVTDTLEYPYPAKEGTKPRDTVRVLSDFDPVTGKARKVSTFADGLNIPIGLLPLPSGKTTRCLVYHINRVLLLEDTDGDGRADRRETLLEGYGTADTHGMTNSFTWGHDGTVHATHGFANDSKVRDRNGVVLAMQSGHTYRFNVDGTGLELWTRGQVNPFGMARDDSGNLFTADCHSRPLYSLIRGSSYPSFGKPHDGLGFGPEMCPHDHGSTGIAGCCWIPAGFWNVKDPEQLIIGNVVTSRVNRDDVQWKGASPRAVELPDLVASDDLWFRPVDLKLGPDGALYVADFYNRIIGHYEVPLTHPGRDRHRGRIWRIAPKGMDRAIPDLGTNATAEALAARLGDRNPAVATLALNQLASRGRAIEPVIRQAWGNASSKSRVGLAWALERVGACGPDEVRAMASSVDDTERIHAMRLLGRAEHRNLTELLVAGLKDAKPLVRRAAAESAMTTGGPGMVQALLAARDAAGPNDDHLRHTLLIALRNRLAAAEDVIPNESVNTNRNVLVAAYLGVAGPKAASFLSAELDKAAPSLRPDMVRHVARHGDDASFKALVASLGRDGLSPVERGQLLVEMEKGATQAGRKPPESIQKLAESQAALLMEQPATRLAGIELAGAYRSKANNLAAFVADPTNSEPLRLAALRALGADAAKAWTGVLAKVLADSAAPVALRQECGVGLVRSDKPVVRKVAGDAITALPSGLQDALAREMAARSDSGTELLELVSKGKVSARVLRDRVVSTRIDALKNPAIAKRVKDLTAGIPLADAAIEKRIAAVRAAAVGKSGDIKHGKELFAKHCAACHQVAGMGARVGPQLDGVALRGVERLAEDVLDPSRNVDQAFRTTVISLKNGRIVSGLLLREEGKTITLADLMGKDVVVLPEDIEDRSLSPLSPMPAGMGERVSPTDLVDLFGYLAAPGG